MTQDPFLILIPPSEGKNPQGSGQPLGVLNPNAAQMYQRLMAYKNDLSHLLGVKGKALMDACQANKNVLKGPTLPAIERYNGVVYEGIDYPSMSAKGKEFFNAHVRIVSALFGLIKPSDMIPDYKLKIEKLDAAQFWKPVISREIKGNFIIDLLPQAHQKALDYEHGLKVDFILLKNKKSVAAGHQGKRIKGKFVRWLCEHQKINPVDFSGFKEDGFKFDGVNFIKTQ